VRTLKNPCVAIGLKNHAATLPPKRGLIPRIVNETLEKQKARELREKLERVVFIRNGEKVKMQKVETGIADSTYIEVKSGVKAGDEVVSGSYTAISRRLKDGAKVALEKPGKS